MSENQSPQRPPEEIKLLRIGYSEMERIVEETIVPEFTKVGEILMGHGYDAEIIVFDSKTELDDRLYVCAAGLNATKNDRRSAAVFNADPFQYLFNVQWKIPDSEILEDTIDYHKLTPKWFHNKLQHFFQSAFPEIDFGELTTSESWDIHQPPFLIKHRNAFGDFVQIAEATTLNQALRLSSIKVEKNNYKDADIIVTDKHGKEVI